MKKTKTHKLQFTQPRIILTPELQAYRDSLLKRLEELDREKLERERLAKEEKEDNQNLQGIPSPVSVPLEITEEEKTRWKSQSLTSLCPECQAHLDFNAYSGSVYCPSCGFKEAEEYFYERFKGEK